jgi:hypothetical protein
MVDEARSSYFYSGDSSRNTCFVMIRPYIVMFAEVKMIPNGMRGDRQAEMVGAAAGCSGIRKGCPEFFRGSPFGSVLITE